MKYFWLRSSVVCLVSLVLIACSSGDPSSSREDDSAESLSSTTPQNVVAVTLSATTSRLTWQPSAFNKETIVAYKVIRNGEEIAQTSDTAFYDTGLAANTRYTYYVKSLNSNSQSSENSNSDTLKTLPSDEKSGLQNGGLVRTGQASFFESCGSEEFRGRQFTIENVEEENLDSCLSTIFDFHDYSLSDGLEDMQAFTARLRRQENLALIELGKRLFHSKTLSKNNDAACSSCHHPAISCGGDGLSLPIGVNAIQPNLLGLGRSNGNAIPSVGRHSPHICNSALWLESMFWDKRVTIREPNAETPSGTVSVNEVGTPDREVTDAVNNYVNTFTDQLDPLKLLMAQAHFPVSASHEMGDSENFASDADYREHLASKLDERWDELFIAAYGSNEKNYTLMARALAAYQASFLFIDNPFFNYLEGQKDALTSDEKRGAILFWSSESGCSNCHDGVFFTPEATRGPLYPQYGPNAIADGSGNDADDGSPDKNQFRMPSLLNVGITAPYGDKGAFQTLERIVHHYDHIQTSLEEFYTNNEVCSLDQFKHLSQNECVELINGGDEYILALNRAQIEAINGVGAPGPGPRNFTDNEIDYLVSYLKSLTDPSALAGSPEINSLIPARDGGPDGNQLDAVNESGEAL